jgi:hypothetical protein
VKNEINKEDEEEAINRLASGVSHSETIKKANTIDIEKRFSEPKKKSAKKPKKQVENGRKFHSDSF